MVRQLRTQLVVILPSRYPGRAVECCRSSCSSVYANPPVPVFSSNAALTGSQAEFQAPIQGLRRATAGVTRHRRAATEETYWAYSGVCLYFFRHENQSQSFQCLNCGEPSHVQALFLHNVENLVSMKLFRTGKLIYVVKHSSTFIFGML